MRIAIIGGWEHFDKFPLERDEATFRDFCRRLGHALGKLGQGVIVASDAASAADKWVVEGLVAGAVKRGHDVPPESADRTLVKVIQEPGRVPFEGNARESPNLFTTIPRGATERSAAKLIAVQEADATITIAGLSQTLEAGLGALFSGKRVVPVPAFGGASRELLRIV